MIKNEKCRLLSTIEEKSQQLENVDEILQKLLNKKSDIDTFVIETEPLKSTILKETVENEIKSLINRYEIEIKLSKDLLKKFQNNVNDHLVFQSHLDRASNWLSNAKEVIPSRSDDELYLNRDLLQNQLSKIQNLISNRDEGHHLVQIAINSGEKVLKNTKSDGIIIIITGLPQK